MANPYPSLNPEKALIWRIVHRDNLPWILDKGLHSANARIQAPNYVNIGNVELIDKRRHRVVPIAPGGCLADYVPFYFTPFSVMMKNIHSGRGVLQRKNEEIVILVSSLPKLSKLNIPFVFTDAHAYTDWTDYYSELSDLQTIDWGLLQRRDFKRDDEDPRKMERYQAEALVHQHLPILGLLGIVCYTEALQQNIEQQVQARGLTLPVHARPGWYF
ncbi:type II toxin-antitoxin system toxin DNA ADP-ribosyl transferase DarT [Undibacterium sp. Ren11W]|uniref:type II toxin-antitoxin system toxin DNA ADP-ribosyl transferase DarT n=1 Tax=Undibacterium sp. Ren11W TaxID=3413045 RepID=UPI003BEFFE37